MAGITVQSGTFKDLITFFMSCCDETLIKSSVKHIAELNDGQSLLHSNETSYWMGNHYSRGSEVTVTYKGDGMYLFTDWEWENASERSSKTTKWLFLVE